MDDGSFPIPDVDHLKRAIKAHGRSKHPLKVRQHIVKHAKRLGRTDLIPEGWD